jgi:hypothetical protein
MRKLMVTLTMTAAILFAGAFAWKAEAATWLEKAGLRAAAENYTPIEKAACWGWGPHCGPGWHWVCGPYGQRCWCARCW